MPAVGRAEGGALVHLARTGEQLQTASGVASSPVEPARQPATTGRESRALHSSAPPQTAAPRTSGHAGNYELVPELARLAARGRSGSEDDVIDQARRKSRFVGTLIVAACAVLIVAAGLFFLVPGSIRMLGVDAELSKEITAEREITSEARRKAEGAELAAEKDAARRKTEENEVAKVESEKKNARESRAAASVPSRPAAATPRLREASVVTKVAEKSQSDEPEFKFFELPPVHGSFLGGGPNKPAEISLENGIDGNGPRYYMSDYDFNPTEHGTAFEIRAKAKGELGNLLFATLTVKGENDRFKYCFEWEDEAKARLELAEKLRDVVLKIGGPERKRYLLFRNPVLPGNPDIPDSNFPAFDLANKLKTKGYRPLLSDDFKPRKFEYRWADKEALNGTNWKLGIRRWKLVARLNSSDHDIVVGQGDEKGTSDRRKEEIIPGEVALEIHLDSSPNRHLVQVALKFNQAEIIQRQRNRQKLLADLEELRNTERRDREQSQEFERLKLDEPNIRRIISIYNALWKSTQAELSLVIGLNLDDSTYLDIAKFGEIAKP